MRISGFHSASAVARTAFRHTSNDNSYSEVHSKTLKYRPRFPRDFGCIEDARAFGRGFFDWYNQDRHHRGIGPMTPNQVHFGKADAVHAARPDTRDRAFRENRARFVHKTPTLPQSRLPPGSTRLRVRPGSSFVSD